MDEGQLYKKVFNNPDNSGFIYKKARENILDDMTAQDEDITRQTWKFLTRDKFNTTYEEPVDFSVEDNELYTRLGSTIDDFEEKEVRVVKDIHTGSCSSCNGSGYYCDNCSGSGKVRCSCYNGYKRKNCSNCNGSGKVEVLSNDLEERTIQCGECDGDGYHRHAHSKCSGSGEVQCKNCLAGEKDIECSDCLGNGEVKIIDADKITYNVVENSNVQRSSGIASTDDRIKDPFSSTWEESEVKVFDELPDPEDTDIEIDEEALYPIPNDNKIKIKCVIEKVEYKKVDLELNERNLSDDYEDSTVKNTVWIDKNDSSSVIHPVYASKKPMSSTIFSFIISYIVIGLWLGNILTLLILILPVAAINDYIINIPSRALLAYYIVAWLAVNIFFAWDSLLMSRYDFELKNK